MSAPMPEREVEARVEWFLTTGDVRQWSGPDEQNPFPLMQEDFAAYLASAESLLLAAEARVRELQAPVMCSVCVGRPLPSGRPCICGDTIRTEAAEMHGLRVRCFELENENATLRAERDALVPLARLGERALLASRDGHGMDGGDIQDRAVQCGVVRPVPVDPTWDCQVQGACDCDPEGYCYRDTTATTHARAILAREAAE